MTVLRAALLIIIVGICGCAKNPRTLKVALYPFIPPGSETKSFDILKNYVEKEFHKVAPDIDLELYIDPEKDPYSPSWELSGGKLPKDSLLSRQGVHVLEIDGLILGELAEHGHLQKLDYELSDFLSQANEIMRFKGEVYGVPTWTCSLFHYKTSEKSMIRYASSLDSEWRILLLYLEALAELGQEEFAPDSINEEAISLVRKKLSQCAGGSIENCLVSEEKSLSNFADQKELSYIGYGETYGQLKNKIKEGENLRAYSLKLAKKDDKHLLLSDALVVNKNNCDGQCLEDAKTFISFFTSLEIQKAISLNHDNGGRFPRYLSSARKDFYNPDLFEEHPIYNDFHKHFSRSVPAPNYGIPTFVPFLKKHHNAWLKEIDFESHKEMKKVKEL